MAKLAAIRSNAQMGIKQLKSFKDKLDDYLGSDLQGEDDTSLNINAHIALQTDIQLKVMKKLCDGEHFRHPRMKWQGKTHAMRMDIMRLFERELYFGDIDEELQSTGSQQYGELILEMIEKRLDLNILLRFIVIASRCTQGLSNLDFIVKRMSATYRTEAGFMVERLEALGMVFRHCDAGHIEAIQALKYPTFDDPHAPKDESQMRKFHQIKWTLIPKLIEEWHTRAGQRALKGYKPGKKDSFWSGMKETRECLRDLGATIEWTDPTPARDKFRSNLGNVVCFVGGCTWEEVAQIRRLSEREKATAQAELAAKQAQLEAMESAAARDGPQRRKSTQERQLYREVKEMEDLIPTMGWTIITTGIIDAKEVSDILMHIHKVK